MFLRNKTRHFVGLARTAVSDALSVASAVVVTRYKIESDCLTMLDCSPARTPGDPPDAHAFPLWKGVSVSVSGAAIGPVRAPFLRPISLCVGAEVRRVIVFGNRRWMQSVGGDLVISEPEPGRILVESDPAGSSVTTFTVDPASGGSATSLTISTDFRTRNGIAGALERAVLSMVFPKIYTEELRLIDKYVSSLVP